MCLAWQYLALARALNGREQKAREYFDKALAPPAQQTAFGAVASYYERQRLKKE